jgi:RHH-type proline utilization regulon transcriptional repressor/proline dehydrogenase/delta 1-pyrroline-5-carboxylate dehydrogenase
MTAVSASRDVLQPKSVAGFMAAYAPPDELLGAEFLKIPPCSAQAERQIDERATRLIKTIRTRKIGLGGVDDFLHAYSLSSKEGLALMVLAETLLRVPDTATLDRLIEDKLAARNWSTAQANTPDAKATKKTILMIGGIAAWRWPF